MFTYESLYYVDMNGNMISSMYGEDPILGFIFKLFFCQKKDPFFMGCFIGMVGWFMHFFLLVDKNMNEWDAFIITHFLSMRHQFTLY